MEEGRPERNVAAILATNVIGLSRHIQDGENLTIRTYRPHEATLLKRHQGFFVAAPFNTGGDTIAGEFANAVEAVK